MDLGCLSWPIFGINTEDVGNDYGESHYIGDIRESQIVCGAEAYVTGFSHSAFRAVLPYFVAAFKGEVTPYTIHGPRAIAWYRTTYTQSGHDGGAENLKYSPKSMKLMKYM